MSRPLRARSIWIALASATPMLVVLGSAWAGCSAGGDDDSVFNGNAGGAATGGAGGVGQGGATGGSGDGGNVIDLDGGNDGSIGDSGCASTSATAELVPLDIVILLDRSGSMSGTSWNGATNAIKSFVQDPESTGISAGIQYFPPLAGDECDINNYETLVVDVGPIGPTGTTTPLLINSIDTTSPTGLTPMYAGLNGVLFHATALQDANPDHKVIVVLATDGDPTSCNTSVPAIAQLAASAYNYNGVQTYTIAISGANLTTLNQIAAAGATGQAFDVTTDITQFAAKMKEIQSAALACEVTIPEPPDGQTLDPDLVNVDYTPSDGSPTQSIPKAEGFADCGSGPGWYYDDPQNPTKILFCPGSCTTIQSDPQAEVDVIFGCETVPN